MPYVLPQVQVHQEFTTVPVAYANPLRAHIAGGHAKLIRYAETGERADGRLGYYDRLLDTDYTFPTRPAGGKVDTSYLKVWVKDALLKYFDDSISAGATITKLAGYNNRVRAATINFVDNGDDYPRDSSLYDRDVQAGDVAKVRGVDGTGESVTLWTYVKDIHGDDVGGDVEAVDADADNQATQAATTEIVQTAGPTNCVTLSANVAAYDGLTSGYVDETYDIVVTESSQDNDFTTAKLRIISGSGEDDVSEVTPEAEGNSTAIGTRGLRVVFDTSPGAACSLSASGDAVSPSDLIAGQRWQVTVNSEFTAPTATSAGSYDGDSDTTYIVTVTRGGLYAAASPPQIKVTTTNGVDLSGPTSVTAAATAVAVGTKGVLVSFNQSGLRKGDRYYIECTGVTEGPMRVIELGHNLSTEIGSGAEVDLVLFIRKPLLEIPQNREEAAPELNWEVNDAETQITLKSGITAYDETWTDDDDPLPLPLYSESTKTYGVAYLEVRYWLSDLCNEVNSIEDVGDIDDISGDLHPDNPLKWGVFKALENANGVAVKYTSVCDPDDPDSWADVLGLILGRDDVYNLVPLTKNRTVLDLYAAHVTAMSSAEQGLWRVAWFSLSGIPEIPIVSTGSDSVPGHTEATTSDGEVALAVIEDDPNTTGTQYTVLRATSDNVNFLTLEVRAGDVVRTLFTGDGFGGSTYTEFVVDDVISEDQLLLLAGPDAAVNVSAKFEVWRNLTATEESVQIAADAGSWGSRRVRAVWPDQIESSGTVMEGYFLAAALAGLSSGVLPQQGLTNVEVLGFSDAARTTAKFNKSQMDTMAGSGVWVVTQALAPAAAGGVGDIYSRHAVTTGDYDDLNAREEMVTRNVDSISFRFKDYLAPLIGRTNATPSNLPFIEQEVKNLVNQFKFEAQSAQIGPQIVDATVADLRIHATQKDRITVKLNIVIPYPLNVLDVHLAF
jgi:hypothetical protein